MRSGDRVCIIYFDTSYYVYNLPINVENHDEVAAMMSLAEQNLRTASLGGSYGSYLLPFQVTEGLINNYVQDIGNKKALYILSNDTETVDALNYSDEMIYRMQSGGFTANFVMMDNKGEGQWNFGWKYAAETGSNYYGYEQSVNLWNQFYSLYGQKDGWDIDNDGDGLPDMVENQGMMGTNKNIYYSNPDKMHSDEDGLTDGEEIGQKYTFINQSENGVSNPVIIPSNPVNAKNISSYYPKNVNAKAYYFENKSRPDLNDTDRDEMEDNEDSYPKDYQLAMIYILYQDDHDINDSDAKIFYEAYCGFNLNCRIYSFNGIDGFIDRWDCLGRKESAGMISSDDYYNITDVVIVSHGDTKGLKLGNNERLLAAATNELNLSTNIGVSDLADKKIENLHLRTCEAGGLYAQNAYFPNVPFEFISLKNNIENVYAFDCNLYVLSDGNQYSILGVVETWAIPILGEYRAIEWGLDPNIYQQCHYYATTEEWVPCIYEEEINGEKIIIEDCYNKQRYGEDIMLSYETTKNNYLYLAIDPYIYHFDPILQRYGYDF